MDWRYLWHTSCKFHTVVVWKKWGICLQNQHQEEIHWDTSHARIRKRICLRYGSIPLENLSSIVLFLLFQNISLETKKSWLNFYVISVLPYSSECRTIASQTKSRHEETEIWFSRSILRLAWTEHVCNDDIERENRNKMIRIVNIIMTKKVMEYIISVLPDGR